jgi:hypothetical protein
MIHIHDLSLGDIGRWVEYRSHNRVEFGRLKSWNNSFIFVVFKCDEQWDRYWDFTGQSVNPEDLEFKE